jgi:hypothetical protein
MRIIWEDAAGGITISNQPNQPRSGTALTEEQYQKKAASMSGGLAGVQVKRILEAQKARANNGAGN